MARSENVARVVFRGYSKVPSNLNEILRKRVVKALFMSSVYTYFQAFVPGDRTISSKDTHWTFYL